LEVIIYDTVGLSVWKIQTSFVLITPISFQGNCGSYVEHWTSGTSNSSTC